MKFWGGGAGDIKVRDGEMTENLENVVNVVKVEVAGTVWCRNGGPPERHLKRGHF